MNPHTEKGETSENGVSLKVLYLIKDQEEFHHGKRNQFGAEARAALEMV